MGRRLDVGDTVLCRFFNTPEGRFYGETFEAEITRIGELGELYGPGPWYTVQQLRGGFTFNLRRREIKRRLS
jgi:hypothetical protein